MEKLVLSTNIKVISKYTGKSKFDFWKDLEVNDILTIYMELKPTGHSRGRIYAPSIKVKNLRTEEIFSATINAIQENYLSKIKFETI